MTDSTSATDPWLDTAARIGRRLAAEAEWSDGRCTWTVQVEAQGRSRPQPAGGVLYQGTAGIALFLGQLSGHLHASGTLRDVSLGALQHALDDADRLPPDSVGFHSGRVGVAWTAVRLAEPLEQPGLVGRGLEVLAPLLDRLDEPVRDPNLDVIGGAAGSIPALLDLADRLESGRLETTSHASAAARCVALARRLGEHLVATAHREPDGWTWPTLPRSAVRHLAGFAHGTAGIGLALLELAARGGAQAGPFRFAAEMAFLAERAAFDASRSNWRDRRNMELGELYRAGDLERLRALIAAGDVPPYRPRCMTAWCHGAPGIGLSRLRAWQLTQETRRLDELDAALRATVASLEPFRAEIGAGGGKLLPYSGTGAERGARGGAEDAAEGRAQGRAQGGAEGGAGGKARDGAGGATGAYGLGFSLCHGAAGNAELLLHGVEAVEAGRLDRDALAHDPKELLVLCEAVAAFGRDTYELAGRPWPSGTLGGVPDPSLLVGDAGIGLFYLRLSALKLSNGVRELATPLLVTPQRDDPQPTIHRATWSRAANDDADTWFRHTRRRWSDLGRPLDANPAIGALDESPAATVRRAIDDTLSADSSSTQLLEITSRLDRSIFDDTRAIDDFTAEALRALVRSDWRRDWTTRGASIRFSLPPDARLVVFDDEEQSAVEEAFDGEPETPETTAAAWLLVRVDQRLRPRPLAPLPAVVVQALAERPASFGGLLRAVAEALGSSGPAPKDLDRVEPVVRPQLEQLYRAGLIDVVAGDA